MTTTTTTSVNGQRAVPSPLLPDARADLVMEIGVDGIVRQWKEKFGVDISSEFGAAETILEYRCEKTGMLFFRPASVAGSMMIYATLQAEPWYYGTDKWEHREALKELADVGRVAEIGAGSGLFVGRALEAGIDIHGYELSHTAVSEAKSRGIPVDHASVEDLARDHAGEFGAACCFQVLEHIAEPRPFIENMFRLVRPGGLVLFSVPNEDGYLRYSDDPLNLPPHHMSRWTVKALKSFGSFLPAEVTRLRCEPLGAHGVHAYMQALYSRFNDRHGIRRLLLNRLSIPLLRRALNAGLHRMLVGHSMYVIYRKKS
jgi:2-polyprenyl-3-methyl-5-hydroxy-6-metoxy-1,4-benzoquinol methylase